MAALCTNVFTHRARTIRSFVTGAACQISRSRSVKNAPIAAVIAEEKRTTVATMKTIARRLRSSPIASSGVIVSASDVALNNFQKRA